MRERFRDLDKKEFRDRDFPAEAFRVVKDKEEWNKLEAK